MVDFLFVSRVYVTFDMSRISDLRMAAFNHCRYLFNHVDKKMLL